jgi:hypothetical protein
MKVNLGNTGYYGQKDQAKSNRANCFIGRGSPDSSTNRYRIAWGNLANKGSYTSSDVVFVSAEGQRHGRLDPPWKELDLAIAAGAHFITDDRANANRPYNVGERQVEKYLIMAEYYERSPGYWTPKTIPQRVSIELAKENGLY